MIKNIQFKISFELVVEWEFKSLWARFSQYSLSSPSPIIQSLYDENSGFCISFANASIRSGTFFSGASLPKNTIRSSLSSKHTLGL